MTAADIPWPVSTNPGSSPEEGSGQLVNCFAYKDGTKPRWKPLPGLSAFASVPPGEVRGYIISNNLLIVVIDYVVIQVDAGGNVTKLEGTVAGNGPVTIAVNNASPQDIVISSNNGLYILVDGVVKAYSTGVTTSDFTPAELPPINSVSFLDGYLLLTNLQGEIFASQLNSTDVSALSFTTAEAKPDQLYRGIVYGLQFYAFGADTIEVYQDVGTLPFPLARATVIPIGLVAPQAIAGFEDGWGGPLIFVAQNGSVQLLNGYIPQRISSDDLEALIETVSPKSELRASVYSFGGNLIWSLSSPNWTWEYNVTTGAWHERMSYGSQRWLGDKSFNAYDEWVVADMNGGTLYVVDPASRQENGKPLIWGMDSGQAGSFPQRIVVNAAYFDFVLGQAPLTDNPDVMLSWSMDGGQTWSNPVQRSLGAQGQAKGRVSVWRVGMSASGGIRFRFRVSHPAYSSFAGARADVQARR